MKISKFQGTNLTSCDSRKFSPSRPRAPPTWKPQTLPEVIKIGCIYHSPSGKFAKGGEDRWVFLDFPYGDGSKPWYLVNPKIAIYRY
jgi:hypothetical protein